ncbi:MAG: hypothetical protein EBU49_14780, partial [Proteobacteria bacterium]|nr:hypothetical protein [Pseudomonadota bacterium]
VPEYRCRSTWETGLGRWVDSTAGPTDSIREVDDRCPPCCAHETIKQPTKATIHEKKTKPIGPFFFIRTFSSEESHRTSRVPHGKIN